MRPPCYNAIGYVVGATSRERENTQRVDIMLSRDVVECHYLVHDDAYNDVISTG